MATHPPIVPGALGQANLGTARFRSGRRGEFAIWWREIDRVLLALVLMLMAIGSIAVAAASPASAHAPSCVPGFGSLECAWNRAHASK